MATGSLNCIQNVIKALVLSVPEKITIERLNKDYRDTEGENIPFHRMGYKTLEAFLRSMPDIVQVFGNGKTAFVINVTSGKSKHMEEFVKKQKKTNKKKHTKSTRNVNQNVNCNYQRPYQNLQMNKNTSNGQHNPQRENWRNQCFTNAVQHAQILGFTNNRSGDLRPANQIINCRNVQQTVKIVKQQSATHNQIEHDQLLEEFTNNKCGYLSQANQQSVKAPFRKPPVKKQSATQNQNELDQLTAQFNKATLEEQASLHNVESNLNLRLTHLQPLAPNRPLRNELTNEISKENFLRNPYVEPFEPNTKATRLISTAASQVKSHVSDESKIKRQMNEADEAIPYYALNFGVFLADFPAEVATFGIEFLPPEIPAVNSFIDMSVAQIETPHKFYFNNRKEPDEFEIMHNDMHHFYEVLDNSTYMLPFHCIKAGLICAVRFRGIWKRAKILSPPNAEKRVKVTIVDFGTESLAEQHELRFLLNIYAELPIQALCGRLSYITTPKLIRYWPMETIRFFKSLTSERILVGKVTAVEKQTNQIDLILCDTTGVHVKQINSLLISQGYAVYNDKQVITYPHF